MNLEESAEQVAEARRHLERAADALREAELAGDVAPLSAMSQVREALEAAADGMSGECQMATPFAPLRAVITPSGRLEWCCSHPTQHCAG
jgi:hypothetical protein